MYSYTIIPYSFMGTMGNSNDDDNEDDDVLQIKIYPRSVMLKIS